MNPLSLLTKGRTFKDMAPRPGAYKMLAESRLPKFTAATKSAVQEMEPGNLAGQTGLTSPTGQTVLFEVPVVQEKLSTPVVPEQAAPKTSFPRVVWQTVFRFSRRLVQRFILGRKGRLVQRKTIQTELALDKVTVLRNDLNDDDLEVVLVKRKVGKGEKPLARLSKMEMTGDAWNRLTAPFRKKGNESAVNPKAETKPAPELSARV